MEPAKKVTIFGIALNALLFLAKLVVGLVSNSIALIGDAFNSLSDVLASIGIFAAVRLNKKPADKSHPFGHFRAEPLAAFVVAVLTAMLAFEVLIAAIERLFVPVQTSYMVLALSVLLVTMLVKLIMFSVMGRYARCHESPAIYASAVDSRNDIYLSFIAFLGVVASGLGFPYVESIAAALLAIFLFKVAYDLGVKNIPYLLGEAPPKAFENKIRREAKKEKGVLQVKSIRAHYVGNYVNLEIVIVVNKNMTVKKSHQLGCDLRDKLQALDHVDRVFVHIDPSK